MVGTLDVAIVVFAVPSAEIDSVIFITVLMSLLFPLVMGLIDDMLVLPVVGMRDPLKALEPVMGDPVPIVAVVAATLVDYKQQGLD